MPDFIALGEILVDLVSTKSGASLAETPGFQKAAGGAPANVAVGLSRLGVSTGFIGKVGADEFGSYLISVLAEDGVDTSRIVREAKAKTGLAFVAVSESGEREFLFYRNPGADMLLSPRDLEVAYIRSAQAFHFGAVSLISESSRLATHRAVDVARGNGLLISFDPNLRLTLWDTESQARLQIDAALKMADVIKMSQSEMEFLTGTSSPEDGCRILSKSGARLVVITLGKEGCFFAHSSGSGYVPALRVKPVDSTGAGDGFMAGLLWQILEAKQAADAKTGATFWERKDKPANSFLSSLSHERLEEICRVANVVGALVTLERGAIPALPSREKVLAALAKERTA
ncbi:MAG: PfkB family carbohydrate kinase [Syntrophothermus sp.]